MMTWTLGYMFFARGKTGLPKQIELDGAIYRLVEVMKHDFFAATASYRACPPLDNGELPCKVVLKLAREQNFFGLPLAWFGRAVCDHEVAIIRHLADLPQTPTLLARYATTGFIYEYIEGRSLKEQKQLPNNFCDELLELIRRVHQHNIVYLDMNKRSNILIGPDQKPYLIDFQISLHIGERFLCSKRLAHSLHQMLQWADIYHLFKHKRKLCPQLLWPHEKQLSRQRTLWIHVHRMVATPLRRSRRVLLRFLQTKGVLAPDQESSGQSGSEQSTLSTD
jgi:serine/threonine protein kinase